MGWKAKSIMGQRREFVQLASRSDSNMTQLCIRFGISRMTGYKWLNRFAEEGGTGLSDRSRRPRHSPIQTRNRIEQLIVELREKHPAWGGRKLRARLIALGKVKPNQIPAASTITQILRRHGLLDLAESAKHRAFTSFERMAPNDLWQMDFKGHFAVTRGGRCHPLTVLDDHSRFVLALRACTNEQGITVQSELTNVFRHYGMPHEMLMDNGPPWGDSCESSHTFLSVWLLRLGIGVSHGRPGHPQTQGKDERFHRTLNVELLCRLSASDVSSCQPPFDQFREQYNCERPHESLGMQPPISRYQLSARTFPEVLPPIEYGPDLTVRKVGQKGWLSYLGRRFNVGQAFQGLHVALCPVPEGDGYVDVRFCRHNVGYIDLHDTDNNRIHRNRQSTGVHADTTFLRNQKSRDSNAKSNDTPTGGALLRPRLGL